MSLRLLPALLVLSACTPKPDEKDGDTQGGEDSADSAETAETADTAETGETAETADTAALTAEESAALATWTSHTVSMTLLGAESPIEVDRLAILVPSGTVERLDYTNAGTRVQDHNSSRSNKSGIVWVDDDFGDDEDQDTAVNTRFHFSWDGGAVCEELPCPSDGRPDGAISSLTITPGDALDDDDRLALTWAETTPMKEEFSGYASLNCKGCSRGHVTVLKVAATGDGDIDVTSAMGSEAVTAYAGDTVVYSGKLDACATHFGTIAGMTGSSWPKGMSMEETAIGTLISLTW